VPLNAAEFERFERPMTTEVREHAGLLLDRVGATHRLILDAADATPTTDLVWRASATAPPIAFHLWHCARWADRWAEAIPALLPRVAERIGRQPQRWERDGLAMRWGFPSSLGGGGTGMELPDEEAATLPFPPAGELRGYMSAAFADLELALAALHDGDLLTEADDLLGARAPLGAALLRQLSHASRHLGMIEALRGARGTHGTATV
jgi:hypothetical protein